jgi:hypothetical protein
MYDAAYAITQEARPSGFPLTPNAGKSICLRHETQRVLPFVVPLTAMWCLWHHPKVIHRWSAYIGFPVIQGLFKPLAQLDKDHRWLRRSVTRTQIRSVTPCFSSQAPR